MKKLSVLILSLVFTLCAFTMQAQSTWKTLAKVTYKKQYDELMGFDVDVPVFSKEIKALDGKEIEIQGYIVPVEGYKEQGHFVFSAYPYSMCYFCGGAGPETVMEVYSEDKNMVFTSKAVTIKGILELNSGDINDLMYILQDAKLVSKDVK